MPAAQAGAAECWHLRRANKKAYRTKKLLLLFQHDNASLKHMYYLYTFTAYACMSTQKLYNHCATTAHPSCWWCAFYHAGVSQVLAHLRICKLVYLHTCALTYLRMYLHTSLSVHLHTCAFAYLCTYTFAHVLTNLRRCAFAQVLAQALVHLRKYLCICALLVCSVNTLT